MRNKLLISLLLVLISISLVSAGGTGGTITTDGSYKIHTFTSNGTFTWTGASVNAEILIIAAGGSSTTNGGSGAGGVVHNTSVSISAASYTIMVGRGITNSNGENSMFDTTIAFGGARGAGSDSNGFNGGSGSGGGLSGGGTTTGGIGIPGQGHDGGGNGGVFAPYYPAGAGGGCGVSGGNASGTITGKGGDGCQYNITNGTMMWYAGGGVGGTDGSATSGGPGKGGGGDFSQNGVNHTGSGAGGKQAGVGTPIGGDGIVIIRYLTPSVEINLLSPENGYTTILRDINFTANYTKSTGATALVNATLNIWFTNGTLLLTDTEDKTGTFNISSIVKTLPTGDYYWDYSVFDDTLETYANNRSLNLRNYIINSETYNNVTTETFTEPFTLNISLASGISLTSAIFNYNGTAYSPSINSTGSFRYLNRNINIPSTTSTYNATFYWTLNLNVGQVNTTAHNQTINILDIDNCAINTHLILNYSIYDEDSRVFLNASVWNTTSKVYVKLSGDISGQIYEFYSGNINTNSIPICANSSLITGQNYKLDAQIQFTADDYVNEYHYIENYTLNITSSPQNVSLYLLLINRSQEFLITFKDTNLIPVEGALIEISRQYLDLGGSINVEISKTDNDGRTIGHFVLNDEVYTIYVKKNGVLLATYEDVRAFCSNIATGDCRINLNQLGTTTNPSSFTNYLNIIGNEAYDDTTKTYTFTFTTTDSSTKTINVTLYKFDVNLTTIICSEQLTSSSGVITCTIPAAYYNSTALVKINVDNELYSTNIFDISINKASRGLNTTRYLLAFFLIITIPLIGFTSGPMTLLFFIVGLITAGGLALIDWGGFIGPFSAFLWLVIAAIILLVKASKRREQ